MTKLLLPENLSFRNYKCFIDENTIPWFSPFNVIIGRNNSGKSSFIDVIHSLCDPDFRVKISQNIYITLTYPISSSEYFDIDKLALDTYGYRDYALRYFGEYFMNNEFSVNVTADLEINASFKEESIDPVPDKSALEAALKEAAEILAQTDKYTEESLKDYKVVVDEAQAVYDDPDATAEEIADAVQKLTDARDLLKEIDKEEPGTGDKPGTGTDKPGTGSGSDKPSAGNDKPQSGKDSGKDTVKAVQTGDDTNVAIWVFTLVAAAAAVRG